MNNVYTIQKTFTEKQNITDRYGSSAIIDIIDVEHNCVVFKYMQIDGSYEYIEYSLDVLETCY